MADLTHEAELTDAMVAAGVRALRVDPEALLFDPEDIVIDVYLAMVAAVPRHTLA